MFGKLFASTFTGSMVGAGPLTFAIWAYVIANNHADGTVEINPTLLAATLGHCTPEEVAAAVNFLCLPDANSRSQAEEGRRLVKEGRFLYRIVNFQTYHDMRNESDRKSYMRTYMRKRRSAQSEPAVNSVNSVNSVLAHADSDADADAEEEVFLRNTSGRLSPTDGTATESIPDLTATVAEPLGLTSEDDAAGLKGFPWPMVHAIFKRLTPEIGMQPNAPKRDRQMKLWWQHHGKSAAAFELLAEKVAASDFLNARGGHKGRDGKAYPWGWIFEKGPDGVTRATKVVDGFYDNAAMAFVLTRKDKTRLTKVMFVGRPEPEQVDLTEIWEGEPRFKQYGTHYANGLPEIIDQKKIPV